MNKSQTGSAFLILVLIMTVLTIVITQRLRSGSFSNDVVMSRAYLQKKQWSGNALLQYAIAWCKTNKNNLIKQKTGKKYVTELDWPIDKNTKARSIFSVERTKEGVLITTSLSENGQYYASRSCLLEMTPLSINIKALNY